LTTGLAFNVGSVGAQVFVICRRSDAAIMPSGRAWLRAIHDLTVSYSPASANTWFAMGDFGRNLAVDEYPAEPRTGIADKRLT
jgi:hypothetical protein